MGGGPPLLSGIGLKKSVYKIFLIYQTTQSFPNKFKPLLIKLSWHFFYNIVDDNVESVILNVHFDLWCVNIDFDSSMYCILNISEINSNN